MDTIINEHLKRPIYNIAHMVNSIKEVDKYLGLGANAIEVDVNFSNNGSAIYTYHGIPCDCFRHCHEKEDFLKFLGHIRDITTPGKTKRAIMCILYLPTLKYSPYSLYLDGNPEFRNNLALVQLDLKTSELQPSLKAVSGQRLAEMLSDHLFNKKLGTTKVKLLISVGYVSDSDFILGFVNELEKRKLNHLNDIIGWDVSMFEPLPMIESMWKRLARVKNIWQGDGLTNCLSPVIKLRRINEAIKRRDGSDPYMNKVYHWTIDLTVNLRLSLGLGVDGIITNYPDRLLNVLREKDFDDNFRLATQDDNPFLRFLVNNESTGSYNQSIKPTISGLIAQVLKDVFMSFSRYISDLFTMRVPSILDL